MNRVLDIRDYSLDYSTPAGAFHALSHVNLAVDRGEVLGLVGESGSGKTSIAWAIMRHLPRNAIDVSGGIYLKGDDLLKMPSAEFDSIRGRRISMVFQDPSTSLNPNLTLGEQLSEVLVRHRGLVRKQAQTEGAAMLDRVGLKNPTKMMLLLPAA